MVIINIPSGPLSVNTYLVADEESKIGFIVDPGGYSQQLMKELNERGITPEYIVLTHGHGDHIGGIPEYQNSFGEIKIVACKEEEALLSDARHNMSQECTGKVLEPKADVWVNGGDSMDIGGLHLDFIHTPGHTPGGMCILVEDCLFSGDTLFRQSIGRTDFPGGSFEQIKASIKNKLFILPDETRVFPGHMEATTIAFEKRNNPFV